MNIMVRKTVSSQMYYNISSTVFRYRNIHLYENMLDFQCNDVFIAFSVCLLKHNMFHLSAICSNRCFSDAMGNKTIPNEFLSYK